MQERANLTPAERELEAALAALSPAAPAIDRDALMFRAGRASGRRRNHAWQAATAVLALAFGVSLVTRFSPPSAGHPAVPLAVAPAAAPEAPNPSSATATLWPLLPPVQSPAAYSRLRATVLAHGADALSLPPGSAGRSDDEPPPRRLLKPASQSPRSRGFFDIRAMISSGEQS